MKEEIYKPYENWKQYKIFNDEEKNKKYISLFNKLYELPEDYIPKAGLLFEDVLKYSSKNKEVLDLGCGKMGILGLLALNYGAKNSLEVDIDKECISWLNKIIIDNKIDNISTLESDLFSNIPENKKFDLILANPPHMPMIKGKLCDSGGPDGKYFIKKILKDGYSYISQHGKIIMMMFDFLGVDCSYNSEDTLFNYAKKLGYNKNEILFTFDKYITEDSVTYKCLDYIKTIYPKYDFGKEKQKCKLNIVKFER